jgi:hypothetical protein
MPDKDRKSFDVDRLLNGLMKPEVNDTPPLRELFEERIRELKIAPTVALEIMGVASRTLDGILDGTQKSVDYTKLIAIADFLQLPKEQVASLYLEQLEKKFPTVPSSEIEKVEHIKKNLDLPALKKAGFINSVNDFVEIEEKVTSFFGLRSIFDYKKPEIEAAFSAGKIKPKNELTRGFWFKTSQDTSREFDNPYRFDRQGLIDYFPQIRWHSTNVELGLKNVIRELYKLGITVFYVDSFSSLHLRGATFPLNGKPSIALTDYMGFYSSLWFCLCHELFHVLFDWDDIKQGNYHLSEEDPEVLSKKEREDEANDFAREYLLSNEKLDSILPLLFDTKEVERFAKINHIHPSFIYAFHAWNVGNKDRSAFVRARHKNPDEMKLLIDPLRNPWDNPKPISEFVRSIKYQFYN